MHMHTHTHKRAHTHTHTHTHTLTHTHTHTHTRTRTRTRTRTHARAWSCAGDELARLRAQLAEQATELEQLRKRNATLEAEREQIIYNASRSSDRRRDRTVKRTTERLFDDLAEVQMDYENRIGDLVAHIDELERRTFAANKEETEILVLFRKYLDYYPDRRLFRSTLAPPWELVRNMLKAMVNGPLYPWHVFIKYLRWVFRNCQFESPSAFCWQDKIDKLSDDPEVRKLQDDAQVLSLLAYSYVAPTGAGFYGALRGYGYELSPGHDGSDAAGFESMNFPLPNPDTLTTMVTAATPDASGENAQGVSLEAIQRFVDAHAKSVAEFREFLCRALLAFGSVTACKRAREQEQRVADTSSQPPPPPASQNRMRLLAR
jgi:hypothetical protein